MILFSFLIFKQNKIELASFSVVTTNTRSVVSVKQKHNLDWLEWIRAWKGFGRFITLRLNHIINKRKG